MSSCIQGLRLTSILLRGFAAGNFFFSSSSSGSMAIFGTSREQRVYKAMGYPIWYCLERIYLLFIESVTCDRACNPSLNANQKNPPTVLPTKSWVALVSEKGKALLNRICAQHPSSIPPRPKKLGSLGTLHARKLHTCMMVSSLHMLCCHITNCIPSNPSLAFISTCALDVISSLPDVSHPRPSESYVPTLG